MHKNDDWLQRLKEEHPERVHDPRDSAETDAGAEKGSPSGGERTPQSEPDALQGSPRDEICLTFEDLPPTPNQYARMNRYERTRRKEDWAWYVKSKTEDHIRTPCHVHVLRRTMGWCDVPAIYGTLKVPLDAMIRAGLLPEDDPSCVASVSADQESVGKKEEQETIITLTYLRELAND